MIVGIAGVTCGGKSTFTRLLRDRLAINNRSTSIIHQDDYFYTKEHVRRVANCHDPSAPDFYNYDEPEAVTDLKLSDINGYRSMYDDL